MSERPERCPHCESSKMQEIVYGLPVGEPDKDRYVLGGCVIEPGALRFVCGECRSAWGSVFRDGPAADPEAARAIEAQFSEHFENFDIHLPPGAVENLERGVIHKKSWTVIYRCDGRPRKPRLEYYATSRFTDDRRALITATGTRWLPALRSFIVHDPNIPGDEEKARRDYKAHNKRVADEITRRGLFPYGDINTYLKTYEVDPRLTTLAEED